MYPMNECSTYTHDDKTHETLTIRRMSLVSEFCVKMKLVFNIQILQLIMPGNISYSTQCNVTDTHNSTQSGYPHIVQPRINTTFMDTVDKATSVLCSCTQLNLLGSWGWLEILELQRLLEFPHKLHNNCTVAIEEASIFRISSFCTFSNIIYKLLCRQLASK